MVFINLQQRGPVMAIHDAHTEIKYSSLICVQATFIEKGRSDHDEEGGRVKQVQVYGREEEQLQASVGT